MSESFEEPTAAEPDSGPVLDDVLGVFVPDGSYHSGDRELGGRTVVPLLTPADPSRVRRLLPRMRSAVERYEELHRRAADAVVRRFGDEPPTAAELVEARSDLVLDTIEAVDAEHVERGGSEDRLVLHLKDSRGDHFLDGYWPAVHFDGAGGVTDLTVES